MTVKQGGLGEPYREMTLVQRFERGEGIIHVDF